MGGGSAPQVPDDSMLLYSLYQQMQQAQLVQAQAAMGQAQSDTASLMARYGTKLAFTGNEPTALPIAQGAGRL